MYLTILRFEYGLLPTWTKLFAAFCVGRLQSKRLYWSGPQLFLNVKNIIVCTCVRPQTYGRDAILRRNIL